jgi:hypothetical protein
MLMAHIIVVSILLGIWLLIGFPRRGTGTRRTPKWKIIFRLAIVPLAVVAFWGLMFATADLEIGFYFVLGGVGAIAFAITFLWAFTNVCTFLSCPTYYRIWKKGGGDPFFDTLDGPLNTDPDSVRYFELYQERARQELEEMFPLPPSPDFTKGIDDPDII